MGDESAKIAKTLRDQEGTLGAIREANANMLKIHKLLGYPITVWRDGKVVKIPPQEIVIPPEFDDGKPPKLNFF